MSKPPKKAFILPQAYKKLCPAEGSTHFFGERS